MSWDHFAQKIDCSVLNTGAYREIFHRGGGNLRPTQLILCEISRFISSHGLQKSYHSTPKTMDIKLPNGGDIYPPPMVRV